MPVRYVKDLPAMPGPSPDRSLTRSPGRPRPLQQKQISPEHMDRLWENWGAVPQERGNVSPRMPNDQVERPLQSAPARYVMENCPPTPSPATYSPAPSPVSAKRSGWGLFSSKKKSTEQSKDDNDVTRRKLLSKKSRPAFQTQAQHKSTPDLNPHAHGSPGVVPPVPVLPRAVRPQPPIRKERANDSAIYFTMDPDWDPSQRDATLFFVSPPAEDAGTWHDAYNVTPSPRNLGDRNRGEQSIRRQASASDHQLFRV